MSGAVYVALIVCSILFGQGWSFPLLCCVFVFLGIMEFQKMTQSNFYDSPRTLFVDLLTGLCLPITVALFATDNNILAMFTALLTVTLMLVAQRHRRVSRGLGHRQPQTLRTPVT